MDEGTEKPLESEELAEEEADVEGHGLKEGVAIALTVGVLAIPATAQAYVPGGDGNGPEKIALKKQTTKKKHTAKPKPPLMPEERHRK